MSNYSDLIYLYKKGCEFNAYLHFGAHVIEKDNVHGVEFTLFAPNAKNVYLVGDFNGWHDDAMEKVEDDIWTKFVPDASIGQLYKFLVEDHQGKSTYKADPFGFASELRPKSASIIVDPFNYAWSDKAWINDRAKKNHYESPINIYEVQLCSWDSVVEDGEIIDLISTGKSLVEYAKSMNYTHIELMPVTEYPLDESWGYQTTGYFSISGRYGEPKKLQYFINLCHENNLGVILDWVPGHFCPDEHGLAKFDGTDLFGDNVHPQWGTYKFDFSKKHVWSFLLSSAMYWAKIYHIDGIRVDSVTSTLYLNFGVENGTKKNAFGGDDDLYAKDFLVEFNRLMHKNIDGFLTFAEDSSSYEGITASIENNGIGFDYKWNMGWMNDTLDYFGEYYDDRRYHHNKLTFASVYLQDERFLLPFSHDEVVHGKKQLLEKMPGDDWEKFASLRTLLAYQIFFPGKKLLFMGCEIAQRMEWRFYEPIEWFMLKYPIHDSFHEYSKKLNELYLNEKALFEMDNDIYGFEWIDGDNSGQSVLSFLRRAKDGSEVLVVLNLSRNEYNDFRIGVQKKGIYKEIFSSNLDIYDGTGKHNEEEIKSENIGMHRREQSILIYVPPLSATAFKIY